MMGMSAGTDVEQLTYIQTRECLRGMSEPLEYHGTQIEDEMRFMNGDNPTFIVGTPAVAN
jgi:hypothetical protein